MLPSTAKAAKRNLYPVAAGNRSSNETGVHASAGSNWRSGPITPHARTIREFFRFRSPTRTACAT